MKIFFSSFISVTTGRWAISLPSVAASLPFCFFFALERESALGSGSFGVQLMIVSAGQLVSLLYLFITQGVLLSSRKKHRQNLFLCIFVWASAGVVAGLISDLYAYYALNLDSYLITRLSNSAATTGFCLALVAYWFGTLHKIRVEKEALRFLEEFLVEDSTRLDENQRVSREIAIESLQETLLPRAVQLQKLTSGLQRDSSSESLTLALRDLDLRAQELLQSVKSNVTTISNSSSFPEDLPQEKVSPAKLMSGLFPRNLSVSASLILLTLGAVVAQGTRNGLAGVLVGILSSIIITALLFILSKFGQRINSHQTKWFNSMAFLAVICAQYIYASNVQNELANPYETWYSVFKTFCGVYLASLISTLASEQGKYVARLGEESAIRRAQVEHVSSSHEKIDQMTSSTIFGALQGQISGVIMALNVFTDNRETTSSKRDFTKFIKDANSLLEDAISELQQVGIKANSR
jgi:hypothetical protein